MNKTRSRLIALAILIGLGVSIIGAWPWISTKRRPLQIPHATAPLTVVHLAFGTATPMATAGKHVLLHGWETVGRWDEENLWDTQLWYESGWLAAEIVPLDGQTALAKFWNDTGVPAGAFELELDNDNLAMDVMKNLLPHTSPHYPTPRSAPDAPWLAREQTLEQWWAELQAD